MDSIQINSGEKRILVNGDPTRVIVFNPSDVVFAEKFYRLIGDFQSKLTEYQARAEEIDAQDDFKDNNLGNVNARIEFLREVCTYIRESIDNLFGAGTSQIAFEDTLSLDVFEQFFEGITPFIQTARTDKVQKYVKK